MKREAVRTLITQARQQQGLLARADVGGASDYRDLLAGGTWREVLPGVLGPAALDDDQALLEAAAMLWVPRSYLSHFSAARRLGIWVPDDDQVWVTTEFTATKRTTKGLRHMRSRQFALDHQRSGMHRWSLPERTLVDLSMELTAKQLEATLLSAIRLGLTTAGAVEQAAVPLRTRPGTSTLLAVTQLWRPERETLLEDRLDAQVRAVALDERVRRQLVVPGRDGHPVARLDVAIPALRLAFEADGLFFHSTDEQIAADQRRDRTLMAMGWLTVRFREGVLDDDLAVRREVRAIVERRRRDLRAA